jgi:hypothetical protein
MYRLTLFRWGTVLTLFVALRPGAALSQDTLSISGTFYMNELFQFEGTVGDDLAEVFARGNVHWWSLTLHGVTFSHDHPYFEWYDEFGNVISFDEQYITRVHATSFDFQFFGHDADILNQVVSSHLAGGEMSGGAFLELLNGYYYSSEWGGGTYAEWRFGLDSPTGVSFGAVDGRFPLFSADPDGYPVVEPFRLFSDYFYIADYRPGNSGALLSYYSVMDIGSAGPFPPKVRIGGASVAEGNRGTVRVTLPVTLSWSAADVVTVSFATIDGTALAKQDYTATSGTLTFQPGQTSRTLPLAIKGDRKREPNETFTVELSSAVGATIYEWRSTVTILNDD